MQKRGKASLSTALINQRRGQVTMFIIVAAVIVVGVVLFFLIKNEIIPGIGGGQEINPKSFLQVCVEDKIRESVELIAIQGGYVENKLNRSFKFSDEKSPGDISYLCYNQNNYLPCVNQEPMLIQHLKSEIKNSISNEIRSCFDDLTKNLQNKGYVVDATYRDFSVEMASGKVIINVDASLTLTKSGETTNQNLFTITFLSKFYNLAIVAQEIVSQEAKYCNFEHLGYMLLYPQFDIDKFRTGDSTTIYTVTDRDSEERFRFAVRSCVIPPGF